jgi:molecular chaperone GrpE (heat shock protein)
MSAIEVLNNQMNAALVTFTELASSHGGRGRAVVRTAPLDRATATFQRLVAEVVDDQLAEMLPPLVSLRNELAQRAQEGNGEDASADDAEEFCRRGKETLEHVLALANIRVYESRVSETFDPLIHLAVGEVHREDLADGAVAKLVQPGFRSARGKVIVPAKVLVNRR